MSETLHKAAGILIKDRKILVEKSKGKEFFISPGGSVEEGESHGEALVRELKEEFLIDTTIEDLEFFGDFSATAANHAGKVVEMKVFKVRYWKGEPTAHAEVEEFTWINSQIPQGMKVGSIFEHKVIPRLKALDLID